MKKTASILVTICLLASVGFAKPARLNSANLRANSSTLGNTSDARGISDYSAVLGRKLRDQMLRVAQITTTGAGKTAAGGGGGGSSVAFVSASASSGKNGTASSYTFTSFAVSGTHPVIVVCQALNSASVTGSSVACSAGLTGTGSLIKAQRSGAGDDVTVSYVEIWAIPAPTGSSGTITVTNSGSAAFQALAMVFSGADQTTPCPTGDATSAKSTSSGPNPLSVTPSNLTANDAAVIFGCDTAFGDNPHCDQTEKYADNTTTVNAAGGYHLGTGAVSITWGVFTGRSGEDVVVAVRIAAG